MVFHTMHILELTNTDGREMTLYGRAPVTGVTSAPSPFAQPLEDQPHFFWHPLRDEWLAYAAFRQNRTFQPPPRYNPLAPTSDPAAPTELPQGAFDIAVFENRFPALREGGTSVAAPGAMDALQPISGGRCEVVVFTQDPDSALGHLPLSQIELLLAVWGDHTQRAARRPGIRYVLPFENRGGEVGVTLHHPHGQIYAYPFVPPVPALQLRQEAAFHAEHGRALLVDTAQRELATPVRLLYGGEHAVAFVPAWARYPYEVWVMPTAPVANFSGLSDPLRADLARALKTVLCKYDGLWNRPFPNLMAWYQAPLDGRALPETQLHAEFFAPCRSRDRLKYLAGTALAAGMFAMDALPEVKAAELQAVAVDLEAA
jgi:UDPglucose--hexose-1-phosphate uridylyltransferase